MRGEVSELRRVEIEHEGAWSDAAFRELRAGNTFRFSGDERKVLYEVVSDPAPGDDGVYGITARRVNSAQKAAPATALDDGVGNSTPVRSSSSE